MQDIDLYQQVLGLTEPWFVERVQLNVAELRVDIWLAHRPGVKWPCPKCDEHPVGYDHAPQRTWRHMDTCQFKTFLHARVPRVTCREHGVVQVAVPWAEPRSRFTLLFERLIIDVLQQCQAVSGACKLLGISWDQAWGVMSRAVGRGQARKQAKAVTHVGVDEKSFRKGHSYMTIVSDLDESTVEHVAEGRKVESLAEYYESLTPEQLAAIEAVGMDMWGPYVKATMEHVPLAAEKIVFDRFHIMGHMNGAVDVAEGGGAMAEGHEVPLAVRGGEHSGLAAAGV
jgi:transposase